MYEFPLLLGSIIGTRGWRLGSCLQCSCAYQSEKMERRKRALRTKQRRQILYGAPLRWVAYSVEGLCFKHLLHKTLDPVELRFQRLAQKSLKVVGDDIMN